MVLDAAVTLEAVRWTARLSALLLTVNLIVVSRRVRVRGGSPWRAIDAGTFGAFLGSHTVHFIFLIVLASGTDGRSIRDSGGWIPAIVVATIFYLGCGTAMRVKLRPATGWRTRGQRRTETSVLGILWLVFFQAYATRPMASPAGGSCGAQPGQPVPVSGSRPWRRSHRLGRTWPTGSTTRRGVGADDRINPFG